MLVAPSVSGRFAIYLVNNALLHSIQYSSVDQTFLVMDLLTENELHVFVLCLLYFLPLDY